MAEANEPSNPDLTPDASGAASEEADDRPHYSVNDKRFWATPATEANGQTSGATAPASRMPTYIEKLEAQLQEKDRLLRTHVADLRSEQEELRRRLARDLEQRLEIAAGNLLTDFLSVLDNLDRALQSATQQPNFAALLEGIHLVRTQFLNLLARHGLIPLERQGQLFDPHLDEAVTTMEVTDPHQHNLILQEWEKGYTLHDNVLRPAKVAVGKLLAED
jgi:molecular chaperone GrpE